MVSFWKHIRGLTRRSAGARKLTRCRLQVEALEARLPLHACAVQFGSATFSGNEAAGSALVTVTRTGPPLGHVSVRVSAGNGSARAGRDFEVVNRLLSWAGGDSAPKVVRVPIHHHAVRGPGRTVRLRLRDFNGASPGSPTKAVLIILNSPPAR
jgi:hypothetical protein